MFARVWRAVGMSLEECREFLGKRGYSAATVNNMSAGRTKVPVEVMAEFAYLHAVVEGFMDPPEGTPAGVIERRNTTLYLKNQEYRHGE
ncbi:hypothetical protein [Aureimonas glaciei]|nr:hypothetical protein [Aureimonas glaciei]